jgi:hypothetical protein
MEPGVYGQITDNCRCHCRSLVVSGYFGGIRTWPHVTCIALRLLVPDTVSHYVVVVVAALVTVMAHVVVSITVLFSLVAVAQLIVEKLQMASQDIATMS